MLWQLLALVVGFVLVVAGAALIFPPAGLVTAGVLLGLVALFVDPDMFRKGGKP